MRRSSKSLQQTPGREKTARTVPSVLFSALLYTSGNFFFIFGSALGLHMVRGENAIMPVMAFDYGLGAVYECVGRCICADIDDGQEVLLLTDREFDRLALVFD